MKLIKTLFCLLILLSCDHKTPTEPDGENGLPHWPMFGRDLRNTSNAALPIEYYQGPQLGKIVWSWNTSEVFWRSPSVGLDGTVYIGTSPFVGVSVDSGFIYAFDSDGSVKWRFKTKGSILSTGAVGSDGTYYCGCVDNYIYAIDSNGALVWKKKVGFFETEARPALTKDGMVIVAVGDSVMAIDAEKGHTVWSYPASLGAGYSVSIDDNGNIYTGTLSSLLVLTSDGTFEWEFPLIYGPREVMIGAGGTIYFNVGTDSLLYALNPNGSLKWKFNLDGETRNNSPAVSPNGSIHTVNSTTIPQKLYKLNPKGAVEWSLEIAKLVGSEGYLADSSPIIDKDGTVYLTIAATGGDNFWSINQNGEVKWSITIENPLVFIFPKPAISPDGTLYIAGDHSLNAIR